MASAPVYNPLAEATPPPTPNPVMQVRLPHDGMPLAFPGHFPVHELDRRHGAGLS